MKSLGIGILLCLLVFTLSGQKICGTQISRSYVPGSETQPSLRSYGQTHIRVVFHLVLPEDHPGIEKERILSQIDALNRDFNLDNRDISYVLPQFRSQIGKAKINFCLATEDPSGDLTSGITYTYTDIENIGQKIFADGRRLVHHTVLGGKDAWDPDRFLNVWIAEMESFSGRSSFPGQGLPEEDGVVIDPGFFGDFGTIDADFSKGRTLVHEIGHYFGLAHPWSESGCEADDGIEDTPLQDDPYFGCPSPLLSSSCGSLDMVQNFMQYGHDDCLLFFTRDQADRMRTVLKEVRPGLSMHAQSSPCNSPATNAEPRIFFDPLRQTIKIPVSDREQLVEVFLFDSSGKIVDYGNFSGYHIPFLDIHHLPNGVYFIRAMIGGSSFTQKIIKYD